MGFFSGVRRKIKKLIPKEVRPFVPYIAAGMIPGPASAGLFKSAIGNQFMAAAAAKAATDDEADLKDILRTGAIAAAPAAINKGIGATFGPTGKFPIAEGDKGFKFLTKTQEVLNPETRGVMDSIKVVGGQGALDYGIKAAELNEEALERYNRELAEQGINDKAGRRAAIRAIYSNTGTWDMDEVDGMLDTYGYRTGGRVNFGDGGETEEERRRRKRKEKFDEGFGFAQEGLDALEALEDKYKPMPIRELRLADGGRVSELKAAYQRYLDMARKDGSKKIIPFEIFAEEFARENFARGGDVMDVNMEEQIDTPSGDMMMDENIKMASDPSPMDELDSLSLMLFRKPLDQLSDDEYEELKDFAGQTSLKPGLIDEYRNYKMGQEDAGQPVLSPRDYFEMDRGAARMGVARGGIMDVNTNMELDIPGMGREDVDVNSMESIKGQTAGPDYYIKRIEDLMYNYDMDYEEAAEIAYDSEKYYDYIGYEPGDYKKGGRVGFESGDYVGSRKNETLEDEYGSYVKEIELGLNEYADKPMSFSSFKKMNAQDYKKGGKVIELMPKGILYKGKAKDYPGIKQLIKDMKKKGTRPKKADGGLMSMGGNEMDLRGGGFVPMGAKERADDVPARLSKNEFVMTADAVRGAGGGSVQKGADLMYDQMKRLEGQA